MLDQWRQGRREAATKKRADARRRAIITEVRAAVGRADPTRVAPAAQTALADLLDEPSAQSFWHALGQDERDAMLALQAALRAGDPAAGPSGQALFHATDVASERLDATSYLMEAIENWAAYLEEGRQEPGYPESVLWLAVLEQSELDGDVPDILGAPRTAAALGRVKRDLRVT